MSGRPSPLQSTSRSVIDENAVFPPSAKSSPRWRPGSALAIAEQRDQAARMYREGEVLMAVAVEVAHLHVAIVVREWWKPGFAPA